jgi:hypothetical protein
MASFIIYPKKGDKLTLEFERFELKDSEFILYNDYDKESRAGFLSLDNIAAILPEKPYLPHRSSIDYDDKSSTYCVYLKDRPATEPIQIQAFVCDPSKPPSVQFFWKLFNVNKFEEHLIPNIFIAVSEVVAIMPLGGLDVKV